MELVTWCCYFFAAVFIFDVGLNIVSTATNLVKIKIISK